MKSNVCGIVGTISIVLKSTLLAIVLAGCRTLLPPALDWGNYDFNKHRTDTISVEPGRGVNLLLPPGQSAGYLLAYLRAHRIHVNPQKVRICDCADSSFINIDDESLTFHLTGEGKPRVTQTGASGGEASLKNVVLAIDKNRSIGIGSDPLKEPVRMEDRIPLNIDRYDRLINTFSSLKNYPERENVLVAVFDSGLDPILLTDEKPWWISNRSIDCNRSITSNSRVKGVNFVSDFYLPSAGENTASRIIPRLKNYLNDNPRQSGPHGTFVTALLAGEFIKTTDPENSRDMLNHLKQQNPRNLGLLVMRVLNNQRRGDSFGLNCAMLTARKLGAEIFNMSLGYRGEADPVFVEILKRFKNDGLGFPPLLVVAAGNEGRELDSDESNDSFYPARLSRESDKIITVTSLRDSSVTSAGVCDGQNFGAKSVDVGVWTDQCIFPSITNPDDPSQQWQVSIEGSSYATPLITGWIAATKSREIRRKKEEVLDIRANPSALLIRIDMAPKIKRNRVYRSPTGN